MEPPIIMNDAVVASLKENESCVFGSIIAYYEDVFGTARETQLCFEFSGQHCFSGGKARFSNHGNYDRQRMPQAAQSETH